MPYHPRRSSVSWFLATAAASPRTEDLSSAAKIVAPMGRRRFPESVRRKNDIKIYWKIRAIDTTGRYVSIF